MTETEGAWKPVQKVRAFEQVLAQIEQQILSGQLRSGDRLPGERQLSEMLGVSRPSVREAFRVLEALEILRARTGNSEGSGSVVEGQPRAAVASVLRLHIALANFSMDDVTETRILLESWAAQQAADRQNNEALEALPPILQAMQEENISPERFNELDTDFHVGLAAASENALLSFLMMSLREAIKHKMALKFEELSDWPKTLKALRREHYAVLEAIKQGEGATAAKLIEEHIRDFYFHGSE